MYSSYVEDFFSFKSPPKCSLSSSEIRHCTLLDFPHVGLTVECLVCGAGLLGGNDSRTQRSILFLLGDAKILSKQARKMRETEACAAPNEHRAAILLSFLVLFFVLGGNQSTKCIPETPQLKAAAAEECVDIGSVALFGATPTQVCTHEDTEDFLAD